MSLFQLPAILARPLRCFRNPLNNLDVIPAKLTTASATRNPVISKDSGRFREHDGREACDFFANFRDRTLAIFTVEFKALNLIEAI